MKRSRLSSSNDNFVSKKQRLMNELDPELFEYLNDFITPSKKLKSKNKKVKKASFEIGDSVESKGVFGTIIYGPYNSESNEDTYEIETEDGSIITAKDDGVSIIKYVAPIEEENEDEELI